MLNPARFLVRKYSFMSLAKSSFPILLFNLGRYKKVLY